MKKMNNIQLTQEELNQIVDKEQRVGRMQIACAIRLMIIKRGYNLDKILEFVEYERDSYEKWYNENNKDTTE